MESAAITVHAKPIATCQQIHVQLREDVYTTTCGADVLRHVHAEQLLDLRAYWEDGFLFSRRARAV